MDKSESTEFLNRLIEVVRDANDPKAKILKMKEDAQRLGQTELVEILSRMEAEIDRPGRGMHDRMMDVIRRIMGSTLLVLTLLWLI